MDCWWMTAERNGGRERKRETETDIQIDRQTDRHTDRQTDREAERDESDSGRYAPEEKWGERRGSALRI